MPPSLVSFQQSATLFLDILKRSSVVVLDIGVVLFVDNSCSILGECDLRDVVVQMTLVDEKLSPSTNKLRVWLQTNSEFIVQLGMGRHNNAPSSASQTPFTS